MNKTAIDLSVGAGAITMPWWVAVDLWAGTSDRRWQRGVN